MLTNSMDDATDEGKTFQAYSMPNIIHNLDAASTSNLNTRQAHMLT